MEHGVQALSGLGEGRCFQAAVRRRLGGAGHGICDGRCHHRQGAPSWTGRKRGTQSQAIGRSKGGMPTKIIALRSDESRVGQEGFGTVKSRWARDKKNKKKKR